MATTLLDVTLREGEQRPGVEYGADRKVAAARELDALGVEYVQVGFPVAGDATAAACDRLEVDAATTGICRALPGDVEAALSAGVDVVDVFAPTSDRQLDVVLGESRDAMASAVGEAVDTAADHGAEVHLSAMDGFRTEPRHLDALFGAVDAAYYTVADTVGARTPAGVVDLLGSLSTPAEALGVHFHDDLGVATANALAATAAGAGKVDVSVAGLGERAGNTALESFVAAATVGAEDVTVDVETESLIPAAEAVLSALGESVAPSAPLLGADAFAHESGLHTAAMLADPATFESFDPARFGGERRLVFGSATGRGAACRLLERAGREPTEKAVAALLDALDGEERDLAAAVELASEV